MEVEKISSVKSLIDSLESNMENLKKIMKTGDEEKFNQLKEDSNKIVLKINDLFSEENTPSKKTYPKNKKEKSSK